MEEAKVLEETTELSKWKFLRKFKIFPARIFGRLSEYFVIPILQFNFPEFCRIRHFTFVSNKM